MKKNIVIILGVLFVAIALRIFQLGYVPVSMTDDETRLVYNAYSIWTTGKDVNGFSYPLAFLVNGYAFNPIAIYLTSPSVGLLGLNMFSARLPFALAGIGDIILIYLISRQLLKDKTIAILSSLVLTFSVWHLQISRFAYEGGFALFFYLLGIFIFLQAKKKSFLVTAFAMLSFLLAFYSYSGTKLIFIPVILVFIWYRRKSLSLKQIVLIVIFVVLTFSSFFYLSKFQNASSYGGKQFFFQDKSAVELSVELERRASYAPEFFKRLYHNKLTYWSKIFVSHYSYALSPQYLFTSQEGNGIFSMWFRGQMYYIEAPLILVGILYLFLKKRRELVLILLLLAIAPLPSALGAEPITYTIRSIFMLPLLALLAGAGIYSISYFMNIKKIRIAIYVLLLCAYIYSIAGYLSQYYFDWKIYGSGYYSKAAQDLSFLIQKQKVEKKLIVVSPADSMMFLHYAFYNNLSPGFVQGVYKKNPKQIDNVILNDKCLDFKNNSPTAKLPDNSIYIISAYCSEIKDKNGYIWKPSSIIKSTDNNLDEWLIFEN